MRPAGTRGVPWRVGELSLLGAALCHDVHVEGPYAVIPTDGVTNIPVTRPPRLQAGGRREAAASGGLVTSSGGPAGNSVEDTLIEGQLCRVGPVCVHNEDLFVAVAGALERNLLPVGRPDGVVVGEITRGELGDPGPVCVHDEDMEVAAVAVARKYDPLALGRPARVVALVTGGVRCESPHCPPPPVHH